jgi:hypothetical protein
VGRFNSEDPGTDGGNWFEYAGGDPTNGADSSGRTYIAILGGVLFGIGMLTGEMLGYYLASMAFEWANPKYHAAPNPIMVGILGAVCSLKAAFISPDDIAKGNMDLTNFARGLERAITAGRGGGLIGAGAVGGIGLFLGIIVGVVTAENAYYSSSAYQDS